MRKGPINRMSTTIFRSHTPKLRTMQWQKKIKALKWEQLWSHKGLVIVWLKKEKSSSCRILFFLCTILLVFIMNSVDPVAYGCLRDPGHRQGQGDLEPMDGARLHPGHQPEEQVHVTLYNLYSQLYSRGIRHGTFSLWDNIYKSEVSEFYYMCNVGYADKSIFYVGPQENPVIKEIFFNTIMANKTSLYHCT